MRPLKELFFLSVADATVLSVDASDETVRSEACMARVGANTQAGACPTCHRDIPTPAPT